MCIRDRTPFSSIIQTEVIARDSESEFTEKLQLVKKTAEFSFEEGQSLNISEVTLEDKEGILLLQDKPKQYTAQPTVCSNESVELSDVQTQIHLEDLKPDKPVTVKAKLEQDANESLIVTERLIQESESPFDKTFKPSTMSANIQFEENKNLSVSEVVPQYKEEALPSSIIPSQVRAHKDIITNEVVQQSEVVTSINVEELVKKEPVTAVANPEHILLESIIETHPTMAEQEKELPDYIKPTSKKAVVVKEFQEGITVTQNIPVDKEGTHTLIKIPEGVTAQPVSYTHLSLFRARNETAGPCVWQCLGRLPAKM